MIYYFLSYIYDVVMKRSNNVPKLCKNNSKHTILKIISADLCTGTLPDVCINLH